LLAAAGLARRSLRGGRYAAGSLHGGRWCVGWCRRGAGLVAQQDGAADVGGAGSRL